MAPGENVAALIDQLMTLFNQRSMDLPDGLFTRHTQFLLNDVPFEEMLGRSSSDPLVLMLTRGPAGYRFTAKAVQHAVPDAQLLRGEIVEAGAEAAQIVRGRCWLSGHLRGTGEALEVVVDIEMQVRSATVVRANARLDANAIGRIHDARLRA